MSADRAQPLAPLFSLDYWLRRCQGFRVREPGGHLGFVEEVELDEDGSGPLALSIRSGRVVVLVVPIDAVEAIIPEEELVELREASLRFVPDIGDERHRMSPAAWDGTEALLSGSGTQTIDALYVGEEHKPSIWRGSKTMVQVQCEIDGTAGAEAAARLAIADARARRDEVVALLGVFRPPRFDVPAPGVGDRIRRFRRVEDQLLRLAREAEAAGVEVAIALPGHAPVKPRERERVAMRAAAA